MDIFPMTRGSACPEINDLLYFKWQTHFFPSTLALGSPSVTLFSNNIGSLIKEPVGTLNTDFSWIPGRKKKKKHASQESKLQLLFDQNVCMFPLMPGLGGWGLSMGWDLIFWYERWIFIPSGRARLAVSSCFQSAAGHSFMPYMWKSVFPKVSHYSFNRQYVCRKRNDYFSNEKRQINLQMSLKTRLFALETDDIIPAVGWFLHVLRKIRLLEHKDIFVFQQWLLSKSSRIF